MDSHARTIAKAVSYRLVGLSLTVATAWMVTRRVDVAASIGCLDAILKVFAFYCHERMWLRIRYGQKPANAAVAEEAKA